MATAAVPASWKQYAFSGSLKVSKHVITLNKDEKEQETQESAVLM